MTLDILRVPSVYTLWDITVLCNLKGYPDEYNDRFIPHFVVDVSPLGEATESLFHQILKPFLNVRIWLNLYCFCQRRSCF